MSEADYFRALTDLLESKLFHAPSAPGGVYEIAEPAQPPFWVDPAGLTSSCAVRLENLKTTTWPFFKVGHPHAHRRCDLITIAWDRTHQRPVYVLVELKSSHTSGAWTQLQASLAFCRYLHQMVSVNQTAVTAHFAAVCVKKLPFVLKMPSTPALPAWKKQNVSDCPYMVYNRNTSRLPLRAVMASL